MRYHTTPNGNIPFTPEEELERDAEEALWALEQAKLLTKSKIAALEATITPRRTREAILNTDNGWLADIENQIQELRGQL